MKKNLLTLATLLSIMKISAGQILIAIVFTTLSYASEVSGQDILQQKITVRIEEKGLSEALSALENAAKINFFYSPKNISAKRKISIVAKNRELRDVLKELFTPLSISYEIQGERILLKKSNVSIEKNDQSLEPQLELQEQNITGTVTDEKGEPLVGVSITIKGTTRGGVTDEKGKFNISVPDNNSILVFSFIGYKKREVLVGKTSDMKVQLVIDQLNLDEVVVVGYGTQKKVNLTGSVSTVSAKEIADRPITQSSQALAGLATGVSVSQGSGQPGNNGASITIRGIGSYGAGGGPLILVDGLATSINDVDPNNIKSVSVLKDAASAAMYGSRAANGVILIETKRGENGKMQVSYNSYAGWQKPTQLPDFVESWEFAKLRNEANVNAGAGLSYTDAEIEKFRNGSDPDNYPNVPHLKNLLTSGNGFQTNHNMSFMGGNDKTRYLLSLGYLQQDGIVAKNGYSKYNFLLNTDSKIKDNLTLKVSLSGYTSENHSPRHYEGGMNHMINFAVREAPIFAGKKSDGTYGYQDNYSPEAWMSSESFYKGTNKYFLGSTEIAWELFKGFTLSGKVGYNYWSYYNKDYASDFVFNAFKTVGPNNLSISTGQGQQLTLQSLATYTKQINKHSFTILGGVSEEQYDDLGMSAYRKDFPTNTLYELNAGSATGMSNSGSASAWSMRSFFSRVNYIYNDRYLFEANIRSDATSRFPEKGRWGYFPSFSAGWIISEEDFLKNVLWIDNLKVRASWGKLGNQNVGTYPYQNIVSLGQNYSIGGVLASGAASSRLSNADITWETTTTTDIGIDASLWKGKLDFTFGVFKKQTSGVLYSIASSATLGLGTSPVNIGGVENTGFEASLNYRTTIGKFKLGVSPNFTIVNNKVTELANGLQQNISANLFVGQPLGVTYGYIADGLFKDANDVATYPKQPYSAEPGFIRFKDISGPDGVPDGKVDATYDRTFIGNTVPKYNFGLTLTANYKGFDLSVLIQGLAGWKKQMNNYQAFAFFNGGQIQRWQVENRWTTENPDPNALYPKLTSLNEGSGIIQSSTYWNRDASFARLKNLQVGYSFSNKLIEQMKISRLRIYFSGQNLLSINSYYQGWDPEMAQNGGFYPLTSVYTFGVNVSF
ncbi:TonB-dependent receptor [Arcicella aquatica]|uniref:TonB-dependent receptor n=1 Tax=Arcicella aquatica TaxID=217141 RepID=A0ABU5QKR2_9BACT|nr:TonB-dependent receptor [Arcicella aquatica]MEA5257642.1 TonB-dependent receptor [Arcicella aquatica]